MLQVAAGKNKSGAQDLAKSVLRGIRGMATKRRAHPGTYDIKQKEKRLVSFAQRLASIVEVFVADGAADEQLARRMLHKSSARATLGTTLPNLRLGVRGKPHGAWPLLQQTLPKDPYISKLMATLLLSRGFFCRACAALVTPASGCIPAPCRQGGVHAEELVLRRASL